MAHQRAVTLHQLVVQAAIALALTTALAVAAGWFASARAPRPLRSATATAHRLSQRNLDERIALRAPRDESKELAAITDAHGGTPDLAAQDGGGLQITVRLPARPSAGQQHG